MAMEAFRGIVRRRISVKRFRPDPLPAGMVEELLELAQRAPSSFNIQPFAAVVVQNEAKRKELAGAMMGANISRVLDAPVSVVFAADCEPQSRIDRVLEMERESGASAESSMIKRM